MYEDLIIQVFRINYEMIREREKEREWLKNQGMGDDNGSLFLQQKVNLTIVFMNDHLKITHLV